MYCIDASVIVNSFFPKESQHQYSYELMKYIHASQTIVYLPELVLPEISSAIVRGTADSELAIEFIKQMLAIPFFNYIPIDRDISFSAAEIAAISKLKGADAIYIAVSKYFNISLITLDIRQKEKGSSFIQVYTPKEIIAKI